MGHWRELANQPGAAIYHLVLLTDGSVMASAGDANGRGQHWLRLTPDRTGSFVAGTWNRLAPMRRSTLPTPAAVMSAVVLPDGQVLAWGGTRNYWVGPGPTQASTLDWAECYVPTADRWRDVTPPNGLIVIANGAGTVLPDGRVLAGSTWVSWPGARSNVAIYTPPTSTWTVAAHFGYRHPGMEAWTLLPDGSVLEVTSLPFGRYVPSTAAWIPVPAPTGAGESARLTPSERRSDLPGTSVLLPDGRVWVLLPRVTSDGRTAFYTPARGGVGERWDAGPNMPVRPLHNYNSFCLLPNGRVFVQCSLRLNSFEVPVRFYEFNPDSLRFEEQFAPEIIANGESVSSIDWHGHGFAMMLLPDGTVLVTRNGRVYVYDPESRTAPRDEWRPRLRSVEGSSGRVFFRPGRSYTIYGELLAGWSEAHGQPRRPQSTNYPLLQVEYEDGQIAYWRTSGLSSRAVAAVGILQTVFCSVPVRARLGQARVRIITNGIASEPLDATVGVSDRPLVVETSYREDVRLIGNLADGGYLIISPGGVQPVGPWDGPVLDRLHTAAKDLHTLAVQSCGDWKRLDELRPGATVTLVLKGDLTERGEWEQCDDQSLTVVVDGELHVFQRADVREVYVSAEGLSTTVQLIDAEALVYKLPPIPGRDA